ncbi:MAG: hypothetical protein MRY74_06590 [Neomegalonema sp.]|nr:hypothetical protein [Neomegalonema sp.]
MAESLAAEDPDSTAQMSADDANAYRRDVRDRRARRLGAGTPEGDPRAATSAVQRRRSAVARSSSDRLVGRRGAAADTAASIDPEIQLPTVFDADADAARRQSSAAQIKPKRSSGKASGLIGVGLLTAAAAFGAVVFWEDVVKLTADPVGRLQADASRPSSARPVETAATKTPGTPPAAPTTRETALSATAVLRTPTTPAAAEPGVVFVKYKYDLVERPEGPALEIWGEVANNGPDDSPKPVIEIVTRDADGKELQRWTAQPEVDVIKVGKKVRFTSRMMYPKGPVATVDFSFVTK